MKNYFLPFPAISTSVSMHHQSPMVSIGSCFAEAVGYNLYTNCFNIAINPFGIVFSPKLIVRQLHEIIAKKNYTYDDLSQQDDLHFSYYHHSSFSGLDKYQVLLDINQEINEAHQLLKKPGAVLLLTLGSSFYYELNATQMPVANCHKQPNQLFTKVLQTSDSMLPEWNALLIALSKFNPDLKIIMTVSPVRYVRDGVVENNVSKAQLFSLTHFLKTKYPQICLYFPAYEIITDCLRDYRFFKEDLVHPNKMAVSEVWEYFQAAYFKLESQEMVTQIEAFNKQIKHSILHNESKAARLFDAKIKQARQTFFNQYPYLQKSKYFDAHFSVYNV
jgi:hypothetical protein